MRLGSAGDPHQETVALLLAAAAHWCDEQLCRVEAAIMGWDYIATNEDHGASDRLLILGWNREHRLRLLSALPAERLRPETRLLVDTEARRFPDYQNSGVNRPRGGFIGSVMSAEQMRRARDRDIAGLFEELIDSTGSHHPDDWLQGGSVQASQEFEKFAKDYPSRVLRVAARFRPGTQERPAGAALLGLAESSEEDDELFRAILDFAARGFRSESFRIDAARALERFSGWSSASIVARLAWR